MIDAGEYCLWKIELRKKRESILIIEHVFVKRMEMKLLHLFLDGFRLWYILMLFIISEWKMSKNKLELNHLSIMLFFGLTSRCGITVHWGKNRGRWGKFGICEEYDGGLQGSKVLTQKVAGWIHQQRPLPSQHKNFSHITVHPLKFVFYVTDMRSR